MISLLLGIVKQTTKLEEICNIRSP